MDFLKQLRSANTERAILWNKGIKLPASFAFMELAGEVGEACNAGKKLARLEAGMAGGSWEVTNLKEEIGDVLICLDLLAKHFNIDLEEVTRDKFNKTSDKHGFPVKL